MFKVEYKIAVELSEDEFDTIVASLWSSQQGANPESYKGLANVINMLGRAQRAPRTARIRIVTGAELDAYATAQAMGEKIL